jgi:DNA-binding GntR family transcriptional regulator
MRRAGNSLAAAKNFESIYSPMRTVIKKSAVAAPPVKSALRAKPRLSSLSDQVWEELRQQIVHGERHPGDRIVELEIAAQLGVSQGTVREALQRLESEGLVERQSRTATYVTDFSIAEMYELSMVRTQVEGFTFRRAAARITDEQCDELQNLVEQLRAAARRKDLVAVEKIDMHFHQRICELAGSRILLRIWLPLFTQLQRFIAQAHHRYFPDMSEIADGHQALVDALRTRDPEQAAAALKDHVMVSWERINAEQNGQSRTSRKKSSPKPRARK